MVRSSVFRSTATTLSFDRVSRFQIASLVHHAYFSLWLDLHFFSLNDVDTFTFGPIELSGLVYYVQILFSPVATAMSLFVVLISSYKNAM